MDLGTGSARLAAAVARLDALVDWERRDRSAGMVRSLEPVRALLARLGDPQRAWRAVHVAGTKGKGTVCALVEAALAGARVRVGCYASPHVERMNERVRVGGAPVSDDGLAEALEAALAAREAGLADGGPAGEATWFDLVTAAAFRVFAAARVEWAVVECGLGGRLDSTNALAGEVCVVTNVDLEHTAVLGDTRAAIAAEKGTIVEPGSLLVTGVAPLDAAPREEDALAVLESIARERGAGLVLVPQAGTMLARDRALAAAVLAAMGTRGARTPDGRLVGPELLDAPALVRARLPGRWEVFRDGPVPVVLDAAHVAESLELLLSQCTADPGLRGRPQVVLALGKDKGAARYLKTLGGAADRVHCTCVATGPLRGAEELAREAVAAGLAAEACAAPREALARALERAAGGGWVLVTGSFYLAGALRPELRRASAPRTLGDPC